MNDSNDLNMNFYSCPLSFNEHICLAQHSIRQGRCVIFFGSVQQTWLCPPDISSTTVAIPARHPPSDIAPPDTRLPPYFHWAPSRPAAATSTSGWAHSSLARNLALRRGVDYAPRQPQRDFSRQRRNAWSPRYVKGLE